MKTLSLFKKLENALRSALIQRSSSLHPKTDRVLPTTGGAQTAQSDSLARIYGLNRFRTGLAFALCLSLVPSLFGATAPKVTLVGCEWWQVTGALIDPCTVFLSSAAPSGGVKVSLSSSNKALAVPASVTVPSGATSMWFNATAASVSSAQSAIVTSSANSTSATTYLQLNAVAPATTPKIGASASSIAFGSVTTGSSTSQTVTLTSSGTGALTISAASVSGSGFKMTQPTLPATLNPGSSLTIALQFAPTAAGSASGQLSIASNSSTGSATSVALTGTGVAPITIGVSPTSASVTAGATQQFTSSVSGSSNTSVSWSVSGSGCSGSSCGTISSTGLYTAPATAPSPATVTVKATSAASTAKTASATVTVNAAASASGKTYYLAPASAGGSDSNNGLSASAPWLTPKHSVNCGDTILAIPSTAYNSSNFGYGNWGTVNCPAGNNVAWLACETFDGCKITTGGGILVDHSFWGVRNWEVTAMSQYAGCFGAAPNYSNPTEIHHVVFANNVANQCYSGGFITYNTGTASVDYITFVGNVAYNAAQGSSECYSGISIYEPVQSDSQPGTHIFVAGNFSYASKEANPCAGGTAPGADGIIFDTFDGSQAGFSTPYSAQSVAENNMLLGNDGNGMAVQNNTTGAAHSPVYIQHNTSWGNNSTNSTGAPLCSELEINIGYSININGNIVATNAAKSCGNYSVYGIDVYEGNTSDLVQQNAIYSASGYNTTTWGSGSFAFGSNLTGQNPAFKNAAIPGAPNCSGTANVPACMATVISNFTPTNSQVVGYGYQTPSTSPVSDPLFPQWLCNTNLPAGLVSSPCEN